MTDNERKALTEFLGECWHDYHIKQNGKISRCSCGNTGYSVIDICSKSNRDFTDAQDMVDLARRMVERGVWNKFEDYAEIPWLHDTDYPDNVDDDGIYEAGWLICDPERFCQLVYDSGVWR